MRESGCRLRTGAAGVLRRALSLAVCAAMVLAMVPVTARAAAAGGICGAAGNESNVTWQYEEASKTLTISGSGDMADYVSDAPGRSPWDEYRGNDPIASGKPAYGIEKVIIESGVTSIGAYAFDNHHQLTSVSIPNTVTKIGEHAFASAATTSSTMGRIIIPDSVTYIGEYAFSCLCLTEVTIPGSVTYIGDKAFYVNRKLETFTFQGDPPANLTDTLNLFLDVGNDTAKYAPTVRYPYGNAAWDSVRGKNYGAAIAPTWTAYGTTALDFKTTYETGGAEDAVTVLVTSSDIPFDGSRAAALDSYTVSPDGSADYILNAALAKADVSADRMSLTLTFVSAGGVVQLPPEGSFLVEFQSGIFAAEVTADWMSNGAGTWKIIYKDASPDPAAVRVSVTASPSPAEVRDGTVDVTLTAGLDSPPFDGTEAGKIGNYSLVNTADYAVTGVRVSDDCRSVTLTLAAQPTAPERLAVEIGAADAVFDLSGIPAGATVVMPAGEIADVVIENPAAASRTVTAELTANPSTAVLAGSQATVHISASNCRFDSVKGADPASYAISPTGYSVEKAELSGDRRGVTLTIKAGAGATGDVTAAIAVSGDAYDLTDFPAGTTVASPPVSVRLTAAAIFILDLQPSPRSVDISSGTAEITITSNLPFSRASAGDKSRYSIGMGETSKARYEVTRAVLIDANTVRLTVTATAAAPDGEPRTLTVDTGCFDQSGLDRNVAVDMSAARSVRILFSGSTPPDESADTFVLELSVSPVRLNLSKGPAEITVTANLPFTSRAADVSRYLLGQGDRYKVTKAVPGSGNTVRLTIAPVTDAVSGDNEGVRLRLVDRGIFDVSGLIDENMILDWSEEASSHWLWITRSAPDQPDPPKPPVSSSGGDGGRTGNTTPSTDRETVPLPEEVAAPPGEDPPSPVQDIVKTEKVYTEYVDWIDRVEPPAFAAGLYDVLVSGSDQADTRFADCLMEDRYFTIDPNADGRAAAAVETVEEVEFALSEVYASPNGSLSSVIFENDDFFTVDVTKGDRGINYRKLALGDVVQTSAYNGVFVVSIPKETDFDEKKKEVCSYIAAVFQAFDRDHPEVFWLSGRCKVRIATVSGRSYFFLSLADAKGFSMCAADWLAPGAVAKGLLRREEALRRILSAVGSAGTSAEQLRALNQYLTEHNEYNTSADLNAIGNEPHECLSALEGRTGSSGPVCDGYSRAFKVVCDRLGIPCVLENGYARTSPQSGGTFHMWNSVELGGSWFGVDVTWNDPVVRGVSGARSGHENERYFLVGANTDIRGMTFAASHPVTNQAAVGGVAFDNGPALSPVAFSAMTCQSRLSVGAMEFQDVPIWEWFANYVAYACEQGMMTGVSETEFAPNRNLSREMLWMILYRLDGNASRELEDTRRWVAAQELSDGSAPMAAITREQMVTTLYRYCRRKGYRMAPGADLSRFPDGGRVEDYAREAFAWAVGCGLAGGTDEGLLDPQGYATRAQIAAILQRFEQCVKQQ